MVLQTWYYRHGMQTWHCRDDLLQR